MLDGVDLNSGAVTIRYGKGGKSRIVFLGRTTWRAARAYLRHRDDQEPALFLSRDAERVSYDAPRLTLNRRAKLAGIPGKPSPHDFRRAFALNTRCNGVDVFSLQRLLGHSDLQIMRRYLAQNNTYMQVAHQKGSPVERYPWRRANNMTGRKALREQLSSPR
jgi:site-specific recombinase XerD